MRHAMAAAGLLALVLGCSGKHEAKSGKDFFEKRKKAEKDQDVETMWKMMSKKTQEFFVKGMEEQIKGAKSDPKSLERLKKQAGVDGDPTAMSATDLVKALLKAGLKEKKAEDEKFVEEKPEGDTVVLVTQVEGGEKRETILVREDGYLKFDMEATEKREEEKHKRG